MFKCPFRAGLLVLLLAAGVFADAQAPSVTADAAAAQKSGDSYNDCTVRYRRADCDLEVINFDQPSAPDGLSAQTGHHWVMNVSGPGVSLGNLGGWRVPKLVEEDFTVATRGIAQAHNLVMSKHAAGDAMGHYDYVFSDGGSTALSDESIKAYAIDMGETGMYFHGTIAQTTGTGDIKPVLTWVSGNNWTTDGAPLLDISKGKIAGKIIGASAPLASSAYLKTLGVDNALPLSTAFGICDDAIPNNHKVQTNTPLRCTVRLVTGSFKASGQVCVAGPSYPEQAPITEAGPVSAGIQTITLLVRNPQMNGANIFQGGVCGQYLSFDANLAASGFRSSYYAFGALDAHRLIYGFAVRGGLIGLLPMGSGSEAEQVGVDGFDGYHLYPGCEVIDNRTTGAEPVCEPNSVAWQAGDQIEAPHNSAVNMSGLFLDVIQNTPSNGGLSAGEGLTIHGMGAVGGGFIAHRTRNGNPYTLFKPFGGVFQGPDLHRIEGYFDSGLVFLAAPGAAIKILGNADKSNAIMTLFALPGGNIQWDPATGTMLVNNISTNKLTARTGATPAPIASLRGTTGMIGGAVLKMGTCATGTATIQGATSAMVPVAVAATVGAPGFSPNGAFQVSAQVTAPNTVSVNVCAVIAGTPKAAAYIVALE